MAKDKQPYHKEDWESLQEQGWASMRQLLDEHMPQKEEKRRVVPLFWKWMAAAVLLFLAGTGTWLFLRDEEKTASGTGTVAVTKIGNGRSNATDTARKKEFPSVVVARSGRREERSSRGIFPAPSKPALKKSHSAFSHKYSDQVALLPEKTRAGESIVASSEMDTAHKLSKSSSVLPASARVVHPNIPPIVAHAGPVTATAARQNTTPEQRSSLADPEKRKTVISMEKLDGTEVPYTAKGQKRLAGNIQPEKVEGMSEFRKNMNEALQKEAANDSANALILAAKKRSAADSQLVAQRRREINQYFNTKEEEETHKKNKHKMDVAVLFNRNLSDNSTNTGNTLYDLPLYPAVTASYKVSEKIGFTAGISAAAPGNFTSTSTSAGTLTYASAGTVNSAALVKKGSDSKAFLTSPSATGTDISLMSTYMDEVRQAYYWQIPLLLDYYVPLAHLKLSVGTDLSIIQQLLVVNGASSQLMTGNSYNAEGGLYQVRNFDPRLSLGAQYQLRKMLVGARFSRSFMSAIQYNGLNTSGGNNQVFNISIGYSLFR